MSLISVENVSLDYGQTQVLRDVSIAVERGQIVTILGPNGAGKSSLLKVALGLVSPQTGKVTHAPDLVVGYVPQKINVAPTLPLSVLRFMEMAAPKAKRAEIETALAQVNALHTLKRPVQALSGGEMQRMLLARALMRRPQLLALDEPVGGVDIAGQAEIYDLIAQTAKRDKTAILMVSHDLHVVMAATDQVVCLNHHVCCAGHPEAVSRHPEYLALFGPRAAASLAVYTHKHDHAHRPDGTVEECGTPHVHGPGCNHG